MSSTIQKREIIREVASNTGHSIIDTEAIINSLLEIIAKNLKTAGKVVFVGFGSFKAKNIPKRKGRNPRTGKEIEIAARRQVRFSAGAGLKKTIN